MTHRKLLATTWACGALLGLIVVAAWAQDGGGDQWEAPARAARKKNPIAADEKSLTLGKTLYIRECRSCHGDGGKGDGPSAKDLTKPAGDLTSLKVWKQSDGALFWKITEGRKPMPSFDKLLNDDERWHVINYLHAFAPKGGGQETAK